MKSLIFVCVVAVAFGRPDSRYRAPAAPAPSRSYERSDDRSHEVIAIIRDDRHHGDDGSFSLNAETANGIVLSQSGSRLTHVEENPVGHQGSVQFTFPDGQPFSLKYVANENGYQPESSWLPVAPEFPHPIPQFVLDQIEKAAREDSQPERYAAPSAPRSRYSAPDSEEK